VKKIWAVLVLALSAGLVLAACSSPAVSEFTYRPGSETQIVPIADIMNQPGSFQGKEVNVKGKITIECGSGCWFIMNDGSGDIYVDLAPSNIVIPQKRGADVYVLGEVVTKNGDTYLIGKQIGF
jgi:hypothetical protein